jgi:hypothetical protein
MSHACRAPGRPPGASRFRRWRTGALLVAAAAVAAPASLATAPAHAAGPDDRYRVTADVYVTLTDEETLTPDRHCVFRGALTQVVRPSDGEVKLGTGPYAGGQDTVGPFLDASGNPTRFLCDDEVSLCFPGTDRIWPSTVRITTAPETARFTVRPALYEADGDPWIPRAGACYHGGGPHPSNMVDLLEMDVVVARGPRQCQPVWHLSGDGAQATVTFCASVTRLDEPPPLSIAALQCDSSDEWYYCDLTLAGGTAPFTTRWQIDGASATVLDDQMSFRRPCTAGKQYAVRVTANDAIGASRSATTNVRCLDVPV